jgi:hypothetical protein
METNILKEWEVGERRLKDYYTSIKKLAFQVVKQIKFILFNQNNQKF